MIVFGFQWGRLVGEIVWDHKWIEEVKSEGVAHKPLRVRGEANMEIATRYKRMGNF